jgi:hypothetical protein
VQTTGLAVGARLGLEDVAGGGPGHDEDEVIVPRGGSNATAPPPGMRSTATRAGSLCLSVGRTVRFGLSGFRSAGPASLPIAHLAPTWDYVVVPGIPAATCVGPGSKRTNADARRGSDPNPNRLRIQLSTLLAAVDDLRQEWEATVELALHLRGQRQQRHQPADTTAVIADLEAIMRASAALPTGACQLTTLAELPPAIENAQKTYDDLLVQHLAYVAEHLDRS